jgi:hypothetical protein
LDSNVITEDCLACPKTKEILLPNSKASSKIKNKSANSSDFVELISSKMNWATVFHVIENHTTANENSAA